MMKRIDYSFEELIVRCAIGCIINNIAMSEDDYVRLYLAFSRLGKMK